MARPLYRKQNSDGTLTVVYDDGSLVTWSSDLRTKVAEEGADAARASAFRSGDAEQIKEAIDRADERAAEREGRLFEWERERYGDTRSDRREDVRYRDRQADRAYGLDRDRFGLEEQRFGLEEKRFGLSERELQHRIDQAEKDLALRNQDLELRRYGVANDLGQTAARLGQQPRSWTELNTWYSNTPMFAKALMGGGLPSFQAPGQAGQPTPQANTLASVLSKLAKDGSFTPQQIASMALIGGQGFSSGTGWDDNDLALLGGIKEIAKAGGHRVSSTWDTLGQDMKDQILGGVDALGQSSRTFEEQIDRGRVNQGSVFA